MSQRRQTHGGQALIQNLPVNANAMHEKQPVGVPQIRHESTAMAAFQNSNATDDGHALRLRQSPGRAFVNDGQFSGQGTGQQDGGKFSRTERMTRPQTGQFGTAAGG